MNRECAAGAGLVFPTLDCNCIVITSGQTLHQDVSFNMRCQRGPYYVKSAPYIRGHIISTAGVDKVETENKKMEVLTRTKMQPQKNR